MPLFCNRVVLKTCRKKAAPVKGLLCHIAGQGKNGFRVVDVWESAEAFRQFGEKLIPILKSLGIEGEPEVYEAHSVVAA
jgi:hypothetical protein